jgi:hypothetical protein
MCLYVFRASDTLPIAYLSLKTFAEPSDSCSSLDPFFTGPCDGVGPIVCLAIFIFFFRSASWRRLLRSLAVFFFVDFLALIQV